MMRTSWVSTVAATALVVALTSAVGLVQEPPQEPQRRLSIAADSLDELRQWAPRVETWTNARTLLLRAVYDDAQVPGRRHESLIQYYRGVPVYGGDVTRQTDRGSTISIFGTLYEGIDVDTTPGLTADQARRTLEALSGVEVAQPGDPALMILPTLDGRYALVYRASMRNAVTYYLDADDGRVLMEVDEKRYQSAVGQGRGARGDLKKMSTTSGAGGYRSQDQLRPAPILTLDSRGSSAVFNRLQLGGSALESDLAVDADNDWTHTAVIDAHAHLGWVYDYLYKTHQYQGVNGRNGPLIGTVATRALLPSNAFFIPPPFGPNGGGGMFFGEGPSGGPVSALDVTAHELMHGVTHFAVSQRTGRGFGPGVFAELGPTSVVVGGQTFACSQSTIGGLPFACNGGRYILAADHSGAIDEALSDVFGTAVEFAFHPGGAGALRADYTMGEDLVDIPIIRSLQNPASLAVDAARGVFYPDHVSRRITFAAVVLPNGSLSLSNLAFVGNTPVVPLSIDDGAVHWNSTILGHAFYLAIEGGQNRTSGLSVRAVGVANRAQIERVFFRAVRDLLPSVTSFAQIGPVLRQAAIDVHGAGSPPAIAIQDAMSAVGF